jgi:hypothetical protein
MPFADGRGSVTGRAQHTLAHQDSAPGQPRPTYERTKGGGAPGGTST